MAFPWMILSQYANQYGESKRREKEYYNYMTGEFEDSAGMERGFEAAQILAPHKVITDPDVAGVDKALNLMGLGWISNITGGGERYRENKEARLRELQQEAHAILGRTPGYEIPKESLDLLATTQEGAAKVRQYSGEALELAKEATGKEKMPGYDIIKEDVAASQAQSIQGAVEQKGVESLQDIAQINKKSNDALKKLALENIKYRSQSAQEYKDALGRRAESEIAAVGLEAKGLSEVISQKETEYQLEVLDPHYRKLQWDIMATGSQLGVMPQSGGMLETTGLGLGTMFQSGTFKSGQ